MTYTIKELKKWHDKCIANMDTLRERRTGLGCFDCLQLFNFEDIIDTIPDIDGETALCPHCEIDSVIPSDDEELLEAMRERYF